MTKKSTKKIKQVLKDLPTMKAPEGFEDRLKERIAELDRPEWDQVDFDNEKLLDKGNIYEMWSKYVARKE